jgi:hypothetical protein
MSPPDRSKGEYRSAQHAGTPMSLEIARLSITLQGGSGALGEGVSAAIEGALQQALARHAGLQGLADAAQLDLGALQVPAGAQADAHQIADLIAARLLALGGEGR